MNQPREYLNKIEDIYPEILNDTAALDRRNQSIPGLGLLVVIVQIVD